MITSSPCFQSGRRLVEVEEYAPDCKIERSNALYGAMTDGRPPAGEYGGR